MNLLTLQHNRPLRIAGALRIECVAGTVWLTRTGGAGDVFLRAGEAYALGRHDVALAEALGGARIRLLRAPSRWCRVLAAATGVLSSWHERMRTLRVVRWTGRRTPLAG